MKRAKTLAEHLQDASTALPRRIGDRRAVAEILDCYSLANGVTFSLYFGDLVGQPYYAVSLYPRRTRLALDARSLKVMLSAFISDNRDLLSDPRNCVGLWHDDEADVTYVDVSVVIPDRAMAEDLGTTYNQIEIYDLGTNVAISTGGTGEELDGWPPESVRLPPLRREVKQDGD